MKDLLPIILICLVMFGGGLIYWLTSNTYKDIKIAQREAARDYVIQNYFMPTPDNRILIEKYGFTDDEINPVKILHEIY